MPVIITPKPARPRSKKNGKKGSPVPTKATKEIHGVKEPPRVKDTGRRKIPIW